MKLPNSEEKADEPVSEIEIEVAENDVIGSLISDRYRVDELIAEGGMGAVYRGEHVLLRKEVAIKLLRPETEGFPDLVARFQREAMAGAHIDHPNVASATDFGKLPDGAYFLVLEYVRGTTLRERMKEPLGVIEAARLARQIASALAACHKKGIVHRDLKPRNIMIEEGDAGTVKLIDFGLAKVPSRASGVAKDDEELTRRSITLKGVVFGTVAYMGPEALLGMDVVDARYDLYALGMIFYELLTGKHPFTAREPSQLFLCQKVMPPPSFADRAPEVSVPAPIEAVVMKLLAKAPSDRYASAEATIQAIDTAMIEAGFRVDSTLDSGTISIGNESLLSHGQSLVTPSTASIANVPPRRRARSKTWGAIIVGLALTMATVMLMGGRGQAAASAHAAAFGPIFIAACDAAAQREKAVRDADASAAASAPLRKRLREAAQFKNWTGAGDAILALAAMARPTLESRDVGPAAVTTEWLEFGGDPRADRLFDAFTSSFGQSGLDVLYEITAKKGGSRASKKAAEILAAREVRERSVPALQVALALRDARCEDKRQLFDRAGREGDDRALDLLERLRSYRCSASRCCYQKDAELDAATKALHARLAQ